MSTPPTVATLKPSMRWIIAGAVLLFFIILMVVLDRVLTLDTTAEWVMRVGLIVLGLVAAGAVLWYLRPEEDVPMDTGDDVLLAIHGASTRLPRGTFLQRAMVLVVGPQGSAKTSLVAHSGGAPELIAGLAPTTSSEAPQPTKTVNVWVMQQSIITELGGTLLGDVARWAKVARALRAPRIRAALGRGEPAARAAVVCVPIDLFYDGAGGQQVEELQHALRQRLAEASRELGLALPVYVMFTRMDKVPQFEPWISVFTREELKAPLGATLTFDTAANAGNYTERLAPRLEFAFRQFVDNLAVRRVNVLGRENVQERRYSAYELPRELRKLIPAVTAFLVDLCRPTQLGSSPQLRGFYFTGARPVVVTDVAKAIVPQSSAPAHATQVFSERDITARAASAHGVSRKVPEWVFLDRFLRDVVLADSSAASVARGGVKVQSTRRLFVGAAIGVSALLLAAVTTSWLRNRAMSARVEAAARAVAALPVIPNTPGSITYPSVGALRTLEVLRSELDTIRGYVREGPPLLMRFGLWRGPALFEAARPVWYEGFRIALFQSGFNTLVDSLKALPQLPGPTNDYSRSYNWLKAYLITTSETARSTPEFLSPVLYESGKRGQTLEAEVTSLALHQFDFYATELPTYNPWPKNPELPLRNRTRDFLHRFAGGEQIYRNMLARTDKEVPPLKLRQTPTVFTSMLEVPGSFTSKGAAMMAARFSSDSSYDGEIWVTGEYPKAEGIDKLALRTRYLEEYAKVWRQVVQSAVVVRPSSLKDAASKLEVLANNNSPLLELLQVTAVNTNDDSLSRVWFQPVHAVTPPDIVGRIVSEKNQPYVDGLLGLQGAIAQVANIPFTGDSASTEELNKAALAAGTSVTNARTATKRVAQAFVLTTIPSMAKPVEDLLLAPINGADGVLRNAASLRPRAPRAPRAAVVAAAPPPPPAPATISAQAVALNDKNGRLCTELTPMLNKYPFSPDATTEATMSEVNGLLAPGTGKLWQFYQDLVPYLLKEGNHYVAKAVKGVTLLPGFVEFFNRAAIVSNALYNDINPTPQLRWSATVMVNDRMPLVIFRHGPKESRFNDKTPGNVVTWPQLPQGNTASIEAQFARNKPVQIVSASGEWALFRMVGKGSTDANGRHVIVTWPAPAGAKDAQPVVVDFEFLDASGAPVLKKGWLGGFSCPLQVAK
jgi:type VI secretion system protein ImpL